MKKRNRFGHWLKTVSFILTFLEFYQLLDTLSKFLEHIGFGRVFFFKRLNALPAELIKDLLNLFDDARTPTTLFAATATELHQIHFTNLRNPLFVILKTQYAKPLKYNYVDVWSIARPIWQSQVNYINNIKKYLTG